MPNPSQETTQRTFRLEMWRSVPVGIVEFLFAPFAALVALKFYDASDAAKAGLLATAQLGLVASVGIVPLVRKLGWAANSTAGACHLCGAAGLAIAAMYPDSLTAFLFGVSFGMFSLLLPQPLQTQIYQQNFPNAQRGKLYAKTTVFRGVIAVGFALPMGMLLKEDIDLFRPLLWLFAWVSFLAAILIMKMPTVQVSAGSRNPLVAFRWLRIDKKFRVLIISWMLMGLGNLTSLKIWVEYFANDDYDIGFDATQVTLLTVVIPGTVKLVFTYPWGWLFDRLNFYFLRVILNVLFAAAILVVFFGEGFWIIAIGTALQGFAFAGGNIAWSLWVTKLAAPEHTAEYMSVHTFTTGLRGVVAPLIGFWLLANFGAHSVAYFAVTLIVLASVILIPEMRSIRARRRGESIAPEDPNA